ncbi:Uncharacterised protein [Mycobacteroides abscessus subsp. abscessus]|nr:Uncharacterised protein [Mycobacteroides abscessus subsp. abscessus]
MEVMERAVLLGGLQRIRGVQIGDELQTGKNLRRVRVDEP